MAQPGTHSPGPPTGPPHSGIDRGNLPPQVITDDSALDDDTAPPRPVDARTQAMRQADGPPMEAPGPVVALIGLVGLGMVAGAFGFAFILMSQPEAPPGAINVSPAAQQPIRDQQGEPLPVQPGEPEEGEPLVNAPPSPTGEAPSAPVQAAPPSTPPGATDPQALPDAARSGAPTTTPPAQTEPQ